MKEGKNKKNSRQIVSQVGSYSLLCCQNNYTIQISPMPPYFSKNLKKNLFSSVLISFTCSWEHQFESVGLNLIFKRDSQHKGFPHNFFPSVISRYIRSLNFFLLFLMRKAFLHQKKYTHSHIPPKKGNKWSYIYKPWLKIANPVFPIPKVHPRSHLRKSPN